MQPDQNFRSKGLISTIDLNANGLTPRVALVRRCFFVVRILDRDGVRLFGSSDPNGISKTWAVAAIRRTPDISHFKNHENVFWPRLAAQMRSHQIIFVPVFRNGNYLTILEYPIDIPIVQPQLMSHLVRRHLPPAFFFLPICRKRPPHAVQVVLIRIIRKTAIETLAKTTDKAPEVTRRQPGRF